MPKRLWLWLVQFGVSIDQFGYVCIAGVPYVLLGGTRPCPNADETISSAVGRNAVLGHKWALVAEKCIDAIFGKGHCRRAIGH